MGRYVNPTVLSPMAAENEIQTVFIFDVLFATSLTCTKLSILAFYLQIFPSTTFRSLCWGTIAVSVAWLIGAFLQITLICRPIEYFWNKSLSPGACFNMRTYFLIVVSTHTVDDLMVLLIPIPWLCKLKMSVQQRIQVFLIFLLGAL